MDLFKNTEGVYSMENGMSAADIMALSNNNGNDQFSNNPLLWLITLGAFGNGGLFGNNNNNSADNQAFAAMRDQVQNIANTLLANQDAMRDSNVLNNLGQLKDLIATFQNQNTLQRCQDTAAIQKSICDCCYGLEKSVCDLGYKVDMGNASINQAICNQTSQLQLQGFQQTESVRNDIRNEAETTRALITANAQAVIERELADCKAELTTAKTVSAITQACGCCPTPSV